MSVCYILPEMMRNMRKIQQAQKFAEPIRKNVDSEIKVSPAGSNSIGD